MTDYFEGRTVIKLVREEGGDFKEYFDMLEEHIIPTLGKIPPLSSTGNKKLNKKENGTIEEALNRINEESAFTSYFFNKQWEQEHLSAIVSLCPIVSRLDTLETIPQLDGCTIEQTMTILGALAHTYDMFMLEVAGSPKTEKGYDVKEHYFDTLYNLAFYTDIHINVSNASDTVMVKKIKKGASKGGQALHKDNLPFKEKYREIRDSVEHQGKSRDKHIDLAGVAFDVPLSSFERWAKEADKEDSFVRKAGRRGR